MINTSVPQSQQANTSNPGVPNDDSPKFEELGASESTQQQSSSANNANIASPNEAQSSTNLRRDFLKLVPLFTNVNDKIQSYLFQSTDFSFKDSIRSPLLFFGPGHFTKPNGMKHISVRLHTNAKYFLANYVLCMLLMSVLWVLTSPMALIGVVLLSLFWVGSNRTETFTIGKITLSGRNKTIVTAIVTILGVLWLGIFDALLFGSTVGAIGSVVHMSTHKTIAEIDGTQPSAIIGDTEMDQFITNQNDPELGQT